MSGQAFWHNIEPSHDASPAIATGFNSSSTIEICDSIFRRNDDGHISRPCYGTTLLSDCSSAVLGNVYNYQSYNLFYFPPFPSSGDATHTNTLACTSGINLGNSDLAKQPFAAERNKKSLSQPYGLFTTHNNLEGKIFGFGDEALSSCEVESSFQGNRDSVSEHSTLESSKNVSVAMVTFMSIPEGNYQQCAQHFTADPLMWQDERSLTMLYDMAKEYFWRNEREAARWTLEKYFMIRLFRKEAPLWTSERQAWILSLNKRSTTQYKIRLQVRWMLMKLEKEGRGIRN